MTAAFLHSSRGPILWAVVSSAPADTCDFVHGLWSAYQLKSPSAGVASGTLPTWGRGEERADGESQQIR